MSDSFSECREIERRGLAELEAAMQATTEGQYRLMLNDGTAQSGGWDAMVMVRGEWRKLEFKAENGNGRTGNLFLEVYSNFVPGGKPGWMWTSKADYLMYYFLDTRQCYVMEFPKLQNWLFNEGAWYRNGSRLVPQRKHDQKNKTVGFLVRVDDIYAGPGLVELRILPGRGYEVIRDPKSRT